MNPNICYHCGGTLECRNGYRICSACGAYKPLILSEEESVLLREAFQKLRLYEFDEAERDFEELIQKYPENPEGYWGRLMLKYGITYQSDEGKKLPVCDVALEKSITTEEDYIKAESLASEEMAAYYRLQAEYIDRICLKTIKQEDTPVFEADTVVQTESYDFEATEPYTEATDGIKKKKNKKKIFLIASISLGVLLAVLTVIFFLTRECSHEKTVVAAVSPTCTQDGSTEWSYCALCDTVFVSCETIPMLGHVPNEFVICTENQSCSVCGEILKPASDHAPGEPATCAKGQECVVCHTEVAPPLDHTPGEHATCTSGQYCLVCDEEIAPASHVPGPPATCTEGQSCILCGFVLDLGGHKVEPATCSSAGYCTVCNEQLADPLEHVPGPPPTCTQGQMCMLCGLELKPDNGHDPDREVGCTNHSVCMVCGEILEKAHGHMLSEFLGCTTAQYCVYCNEEMVPATAHKPGPPATCTEAQECLVCNEELSPALNHRVKDWIFDKEPALGVAGSKHGECPLCVQIVYQEVAPLYSDGLSYTLKSDGTYSVSGVGTCTDAWIVLPSVHMERSVTSIDDNAFYSVSTVQKITIPESITIIGNRAFYLCRNLRDVSLSEGVKNIGDFAFYGCSSLSAVSLPKSVTSIGNQAFSGCSKLTEIVLPLGLKSIGISAFENCAGLIRVTVPNGVTAIGDRTFYNCGQLKEVVLPNSIKSIGNYAFYFCNGLEQISLPAQLTNIGAYAFYRCTGLTSVVLPETVTEIGEYAFALCVGIGEINLPGGVTAIGQYAFDACRKLKNISFGGLTEQWKLIAFGEGWCSDVPADKVICSDGEAPLP